jgi:Mn-dependent DtxR family transcriptional regulator
MAINIKMKKTNLTPREQELYTLLLKGYKKDGYCPEQIEVAKVMNVSKEYVQGLVRTLLEKGYIKRPKRGLVIPI